MKTAVIISGQMRTFRRCYPTQYWQVYRHYEPDIHFFVSCLDDENASSAGLLKERYRNVHIERYQDPIDLPEIESRFGDHAPYANATSHKHLMLQHWGNKRAWDWFTKSDGVLNSDFTTFIRMRADNLFHSFYPPTFPHESKEGWDFVNRPVPERTCYTPWWGKFGGVNDRFAIMGYEAARAYFLVIDRIPQLLAAGCPFHPESLVAASLELSHITVKNMDTIFSTLRSDGNLRLSEITGGDLFGLILNR